MDEDGPIVIRKGGTLSALAYGLFGTLSVAVVCGTALAFYGMYIVDRQISNVLTASPEIVAELAAWQDALPPALYDAIHDERAPDYAQQLDVEVKLASRDDGNGMVWPVVEVVNRGDRTVSLMGLRIMVEDAAGIPVQESNTFAATPLAVDGDWRGPLLPGARRRLTARPVWQHERPASAAVEITELRVWDESAVWANDELLSDVVIPLDEIDGIPVEAVSEEDLGEPTAAETSEPSADSVDVSEVPHENAAETVPDEDGTGTSAEAAPTNGESSPPDVVNDDETAESADDTAAETHETTSGEATETTPEVRL